MLNGVLEARAPGPQAPLQPDGRRREAALPRDDDDRGVLARGGLGARPRRRVRAGRRDLPHRRVHRPAPRRARRAALARRRLRRVARARLRLLRRRPPHVTQERPRPLGPDGARRRRRARPASPTASTGPATTTSSSRASPAATSTRSALSRRYKAALARAALRPLRFHDLRHTFGTRMIAKADILKVQEWMGHADIATTQRYLHYVERPDEVALVAEAFARRAARHSRGVTRFATTHASRSTRTNSVRRPTLMCGSGACASARRRSSADAEQRRDLVGRQQRLRQLASARRRPSSAPACRDHPAPLARERLGVERPNASASTSRSAGDELRRVLGALVARAPRRRSGSPGGRD